jgi:hypothetical protein
VWSARGRPRLSRSTELEFTAPRSRFAISRGGTKGRDPPVPSRGDRGREVQYMAEDEEEPARLCPTCGMVHSPGGGCP